MFYGFLISIHIIICVCLITIVLIQAGRGGGLAESFSGAESIFGTKTNSFLTRSTTVLAVAFFITCLSLAFISRQRSKSLISPGNIPKPKAEAEVKAEPKEDLKHLEVAPAVTAEPAKAETPEGAPEKQ